MTMVYFTINKMLKDNFKCNMEALCASLDDNSGCLPRVVETNFQKKCQEMKLVEDFNKYYGWVGRDCPDAKALQIRLRRAIDNSKKKRYHGSSEHMNVLPDLDEQAKTHLLGHPTPFVYLDKEKKVFVKPPNAPKWKHYL